MVAVKFYRKKWTDVQNQLPAFYVFRGTKEIFGEDWQQFRKVGCVTAFGSEREIFLGAEPPQA